MTPDGPTSEVADMEPEEPVERGCAAEPQFRPTRPARVAAPPAAGARHGAAAATAGEPGG